MAVHIHTQRGSLVIGSHLSLNVTLAVVPKLPRPLLSRLVGRAIERLDELDGDCDLEPEVTEQDDEPEDDDPGGGNIEDEGENAAAEDEGECGEYEDDQRELRWRYGALRTE